MNVARFGRYAGRPGVRRWAVGRQDEGVRRVVILGRGGAGKPALSRQLSEMTGLPAVELGALFFAAWARADGPVRVGRVST